MHSGELRILSVRSESTAKDTAIVAIADTGSGVDPADLNRIFKPMFTTKANGMGMGLSICKSIIENHKGRIWVSAGDPKGAIFHFELPAKQSTKGKFDYDVTGALLDSRPRSSTPEPADKMIG
jgi:signal transduction histidine kinase